MKLLKFYTNTCQPCKVYAPIFDRVTQQMWIETENIDANNNQTSIQVTKVPTTVVVKDGVEVARVVWPIDEASLIQLIHNHLQ